MIDTSSSGNLIYGSGQFAKQPSSTKMSNQSINKFTKLNRNMAAPSTQNLDNRANPNQKITVEDYTTGPMGAIANNAKKSTSPNRTNANHRAKQNPDINERDLREEYDCSTRMLQDYHGDDQTK